MKAMQTTNKIVQTDIFIHIFRTKTLLRNLVKVYIPKKHAVKWLFSYRSRMFESNTVLCILNTIQISSNQFIEVSTIIKAMIKNTVT